MLDDWTKAFKELTGRAQVRGVAHERSFGGALWRPNTSSEYAMHKEYKSASPWGGLALARRLRLDSGRVGALNLGGCSALTSAPLAQ